MQGVLGPRMIPCCTLMAWIATFFSHGSSITNPADSPKGCGVHITEQSALTILNVGPTILCFRSSLAFFFIYLLNNKL